MTNEIERNNLLLQTLNQVAIVLLDPELTGMENNIYGSMDMMVKAVNADRVSIWKNHIYHDELCASQLYEWSEELVPQQNADYTVNISYKKNMPDWEKLFSSGQCVNGLTDDMEPNSRNFLAIMQVQSIFAAPIFVRDHFWGFIEFDDCHIKRTFSENEVAILRSCCLLIGNVFLRSEMTLDLQNNIKELKNLHLELEKALDDAKAASRSKTSFLANMSHEIRTPMNSIIGFSELAIDDNISPKANDYFLKILDNSKWLLHIINDILDLSKIESGKMELENIQFNLHEIFAASKTLIMPKVIEKGLKTSFFIEPVTGRKMFSDPTRLRQVLVNLLSNAVKFTDSGTIEMQAVVKEITPDSVTISFIIKDSGIGIAPDQIKKIMDPFTQAESGTTRKFGGTGLGLPITKNIIEMMGGSLSVESTPGAGSKFSFEVTFNTINAAADNDITEHSNFDNLEKPVFDGEILICEDNIMNQQVIREHLTRVGLKTIVASNGREGVEYIENRAKRKEKQFDLVFMDIHMPVMDGLKAAAAITSIDKSIPIVAMTANVITDDRENYLSMGMVDCVGKPFSSQELWLCLMKYIKSAAVKKDKTANQEESDHVFYLKLVNYFVKINCNKFQEITSALDSGDIKLAHMLVHTLKSNAGQLKKTHLQKISEEVENCLKNGENLVTEQQLSLLEKELISALNDFKLLIDEVSESESVNETITDTAAAQLLLNELEPLLKQGNAECLSYIEKLKSIKGSKKLISQIEDLDFEPAILTLAELKAGYPA
ncbi:MAG: ATP-binding protein [Treponema sp.]|nr:ATP-binding protein [Treponema sp.]